MEVNDDVTSEAEAATETEVQNGGTETQTETSRSVSRRSFLQASGTVAGLAALGVGAGRTNALEAETGTSTDFLNWRVREARHAWERGYRGRPDRTVGLTDSGIEARHPDLGPWNGVRAVTRDGELILTTDSSDTVDRVELDASESFSGTIGPGTFVAPVTKRHAFTAPADADEIQATVSWSLDDTTGTTVGEDLEFYIEDASGERVATAATANNPETITTDVQGGAEYAFVVETYLNLTANYELAGNYYQYQGSLSTYTGSVFDGIDPSNITPDTPKTVGWYDESDRYGRYDRPRDGNGHGTHVSSIMSGSGRASAIDPTTVVEEEPQTTLALGDALTYEVSARADAGVYASAYGEFIEISIEGPDGRELASSTVGIDDTSEWDNNVTDTPTIHGSGEATYTVHITPYDGEILTAATVKRVSVGAFLREDETTGNRTAGNQTVHAGLAPNASLLGLQGLGGATADLAKYAGAFSDLFNLRVVNMSWGYIGGAPLGAAGGLLAEDPTLIADIAAAGIFVSASAGNSATPINSGGPAIADESISVVATGPLDGITSYSSGGLAAYDEDTNTAYRKPDVTAPGGTLIDLVRAAKNGDPTVPEDEQPPICDHTGKAGTSMAAPYVSGISSLVAEAMESDDAPVSIRLPEPAKAGLDDVLRLKQAILATASETTFTAAPYHRAHTPTYDFGGRDPFEGFGRANPGTAIDAVTRELSGTSTETVGLNVPEDERAVAGYVTAGPGTVNASVSFSYYSGANKGAAEGAPHVDLFVYDAENPTANGEPNIVGRAQGLQGDASVTVSLGRNSPEKTLYVVAKLVNVPGVTNGFDVQAHLDLSVSTEEGFFADGTRSDDGSVFTAGQTDQIDVVVNPSEPSAVRDTVPSEWTVLTEHSDDVTRVEEAGDVQHVYFDDAAADTDSAYSYFVEAPDAYQNSGEYAFGPVEVNPETGWVAVSGTSDTNVVIGQQT